MILDWPGVSVDLRRGVATRAGSEIALTSKEVRLLEFLAGQQERIVGRDELLREVWGYSASVVSRASDNAIQRLRAKLEADPAKPTILVTVHGEGYRLLMRTESAPAAAAAAPISTEPVFAAGGVTVDLRVGTIAGKPLTANEISVLKALYVAAGGSVDRDALQRQVWGSASGRALEHTVSRLRKKAPDAVITTVTGYRLATAPRVASAGLPDEPDQRIGRDALVADVVEALERQRLITLIGLGGSGKTRTALACAQRMAERGQRVFWVDLSAAESADAIALNAARTLGVEGSATDLGGAVAAALDAGGVLILDNLEQIDGAAAAVVALLDRARELRILATSRVPLRVRIEKSWPMPPLPAEEAAALFVARCPETPTDGALVAAIVAELDGWPLAIELAAARTRILSLVELRDRLVQARPALLTIPDRDRPSRHTSVRSALRATFDLLPAASRSGLCQLTVFAGGFTVEAAEGVVQGGFVPDLLRDLTDAQLIRRDEGRFAMPVVVRDHAAELTRGTERADAEIRHGAAFAEIGWGLGPWIDLPTWSRLLPDLANLEIGCRRAIKRGDARIAVGCALAYWAVVERKGPFSAATPLLREVAALEPDGWGSLLLGEALLRSGSNPAAHAALSRATAEPACRARALLGRARTAVQLDREADLRADLDAIEHEPGYRARILLLRGLMDRRLQRLPDAIDRLQAGVRAAQVDDDPRAEAELRAELANTLGAVNSPIAEDEHVRAIAAAERVDDPLLVNRVQLSRLWSMVGRDPRAAVRPLIERADWCRDRGAVAREVWCLLTAANAAMFQADLETTEAVLDRAERRPMSPQNEAACDRLRAIVQWHRGDHEGAIRRFERILGDARARNDLGGVFMVEAELAELLRGIRRLDEARDRAQRAFAFFDSTGWALQQSELLLLLGNIERDAGNVEAARGCYAQALERGRSVGAQRVIAAAEAELGKS